MLEAFKDWLSMRLSDCREMTQTIGESLDRKLGLWERLVMYLHLLTCDRCERYLQQLGFLNRTLRSHGEKVADPESIVGSEFRAESKERMKQILAGAALARS